MIMTSFVVQVSGYLPPHALDRDGSVHRQAVVRAVVRDQAAMFGFLKVLSDLGLDLVDLRRLPLPGAPGDGPLHDHGTPLLIEVVIHGSVGDLAVSALCDHVEVTHMATRLVLSDRRLVGEVLDWALTAGATVEFATDAQSSSPGEGDARAE